MLLDFQCMHLLQRCNPSNTNHPKSALQFGICSPKTNGEPPIATILQDRHALRIRPHQYWVSNVQWYYSRSHCHCPPISFMIIQNDCRTGAKMRCSICELLHPGKLSSCGVFAFPRFFGWQAMSKIVQKYYPLSKGQNGKSQKFSLKANAPSSAPLFPAVVLLRTFRNISADGTWIATNANLPDPRNKGKQY